MAKITFNARMGQRFRKITCDYGKIDQYIHETAMMIIGHAKDHGDCSTAQGLINSMPQSARKLALINWFKKFTPIVVKDDANWESKMHKPESKMYKPFDIEGAEATPWFTLADGMGAEKPAVDYSGMLAWLEAQAKQWEKKAEDATKVDPSAHNTALALAAQLRAIKLPALSADNNNDDSQLLVKAAG